MKKIDQAHSIIACVCTCVYQRSYCAVEKNWKKTLYGRHLRRFGERTKCCINLNERFILFSSLKRLLLFLRLSLHLLSSYWTGVGFFYPSQGFISNKQRITSPVIIGQTKNNFVGRMKGKKKKRGKSEIKKIKFASFWWVMLLLPQLSGERSSLEMKWKPELFFYGRPYLTDHFTILEPPNLEID